jgi:hypothetical protein
MQSEPLSKIVSAAEIAQRIQTLSNDVLGLAADLVAALDVRPELTRELVQLGVNRGLIDRLEKLGRRQIDARLVFATSPGALRLLPLPLSEQELALRDGVEVLDADEVTTRNIPVNELTAKQAKQVFADGRQRTLAEQRTYIRDKRKPVVPVDSVTAYRVERGRVVVLRPGCFSRQTILQWLTEMN